jgi:hypothetical protein
MGTGHPYYVRQIVHNPVSNKTYVLGASSSPGYYYRGAWYNLDVDIPSNISSPSALFVALRSTGEEVFFRTANQGTLLLTAPLAGTAIVDGGARAAPAITIRNGGAITQVNNVTTGDRLYLDNFTMTASEVVTLDFAKRSYTSSQRGDLLGYIRPGSRVSGWSLVPGTNIVNISASNGTAAVIDIAWRNTYWSIDT